MSHKATKTNDGIVAKRTGEGGMYVLNLEEQLTISKYPNIECTSKLSPKMGNDCN